MDYENVKGKDGAMELDMQKVIKGEVEKNAKTRFLSNMSHELRTPINSILGLSEIIMREAIDMHVAECASSIRNISRTLLDIVDEVMYFSSLDTWKLVLQKKEYSLFSLVESVYSLFAERLARKNVAFRLCVDEHLPDGLLGDSPAVRQVIVNLLSNAEKFTESGEVSLTLAGKTVDGQLELFVEVADTGVGIVPEKLKFLLTETALEESGVEGRGLKIAHHLLNKMDAQLGAESKLGKGTRFFFVLSQEVCDTNEVGDVSSKIQERSEEYYFRANLRAPKARILLVDDNEMNLQVIKGLLEPTKIQVDTAASGLDAVEMVKNEQYNLLLIDAMMPELDGVQTMLRIREQKLISDTVPIIVLTADAVDGAKENYIERGFDAYLSKPISYQELEATLRAFLPRYLVEEKSWDMEEQKTVLVYDTSPERLRAQKERLKEHYKGVYLMNKLNVYQYLETHKVDYLMSCAENGIILDPEEMRSAGKQKKDKRLKVLITGSNRMMADELYKELGNPKDYAFSICAGIRDVLLHKVAEERPYVVIICTRSDDTWRNIGVYDSLNLYVDIERTEVIVVGTRDSCEFFKKITKLRRMNFLYRPINMYALRDKLEEIADKCANMRRNMTAFLEEFDKKPSEEDIRNEDRKRILVIDDDAQQLQQIKDHLSEFYHVALAPSGKAAYSYLEKYSVDLILLDYKMPEESGPEVLEKLRANPKTAGIPVIFLTAVSGREAVTTIVLKLKPQGYLVKPAKKIELVSKIIEILG